MRPERDGPRQLVRVTGGLDPPPRSAERRGSFVETESMMDAVGVTWDR